MTKTDSTTLPEPKNIPFEFFAKPGNKTTKLVNSDQNFSIDGTNRWYEFEFKEPVYLTEIEIRSSGYDDWNKFHVQVFHIDETTHTESISVTSGVVSLSLGKLCRKFRFKPDPKWLQKTEISLVTATGYTLKEFHSFEWEIQELARREERISEREFEIGVANDAYNERLDEIKALKQNLVGLESQRTELSKTISQLEEQKAKGEVDIKDLRSELKDLQEQRRIVKSDVVKEASNLRNLTTKIRLFPSEIAGFVDQGNKNIRTYIFIGIPFACIFIIVLWSLFFSAIDLTQVWKIEGGVDIWSIFLTRLPFVLVAFALIESCGFIVGRLIFEIVKINRQRLEFSKLSIVAKDITTASASKLEMTEVEKFQEETKIKMMMLQEHMKTKSSDEFKFQGSLISSAISGIVDKVSSKNSG